MEKFLKFFDGKKTYIVATVMAGLAFAEHAGWLTPQDALAILTFLNGLGFAAVRAGVKKDVEDIE